MATILVHAGANLQAALNSAAGGDTLVLDAGATFTGNFILPVHSGSYITITSAGTLPVAGTRVSPTTAAAFAKIQAPTGGAAAVAAATAAAFWKIIGVEFPNNPGGFNDIIQLGSGDTTVQSQLSQVPQHLVIDRCYIHGDPSIGQKRGIAMNSGDTQVINCYISDIKAVGQDTQAIAGWNGPGPFLINNNYLEAGGENFLTGGADAAIQALGPANLTFTNNYVAKPLAWRTQNWQIKNLFELKSCATATIDSNIFENNWISAQPNGIPILFTVRNNDLTNPWANITNVTFTNNIVRHAGGGISVLGHDDRSGVVSGTLTNLLIQNNEFYDITEVFGQARFLQLNNGSSGVRVLHNTCINTQSSGAVAVYFIGSAPNTGFQFINNIFYDNGLGVFGDQGQQLGTATLNNQAPGWVFNHNVLVGSPFSSLYPAGNFFPADTTTVQFVNPGAANYRLQATSPFHAAASDGQDIGVLLGSGVISGTAGVTAPAPRIAAVGLLPGSGGVIAPAVNVAASGLVVAPGTGPGAVTAVAPVLAAVGTFVAASSGAGIASVAFNGPVFSAAGAVVNLPPPLVSTPCLDTGIMQQIQNVVIEPPDGGQTWVSGLWTKAEVAQYIDQRQNEFLKESQLQIGVALIPTVAGQSTYDLPDDWMTTVRVLWIAADGATLELPRSDTWEADYGMPTWSYVSGTPKIFYDGGKPITIQVMPVPNAAGTLQIHYVPYAAVLTGDGETLTIPCEFGPALKYAALGDMLMKIGRANDPIRASYCMKRFRLGVQIARLLVKGF